MSRNSVRVPFAPVRGNLSVMHIRRGAQSVLYLLLGVCANLPAQSPLPDAKPVPHVQAVPQPYGQVSFERDGQEIARFHFGPGLNRPFVFPIIGPPAAR